MINHNVTFWDVRDAVPYGYTGNVFFSSRDTACRVPTDFKETFVVIYLLSSSRYQPCVLCFCSFCYLFLILILNSFCCS